MKNICCFPLKCKFPPKLKVIHSFPVTVIVSPYVCSLRHIRLKMADGESLKYFNFICRRRRFLPPSLLVRRPFLIRWNDICRLPSAVCLIPCECGITWQQGIHVRCFTQSGGLQKNVVSEMKQGRRRFKASSKLFDFVQASTKGHRKMWQRWHLGKAFVGGESTKSYKILFFWPLAKQKRGLAETKKCSGCWGRV